MAQVAAQALRLMHHGDPQGPWTVEGLPALELKKPDGQSICEAGCYQCLLSYFNQPDHPHKFHHGQTRYRLVRAPAPSKRPENPWIPSL